MSIIREINLKGYIEALKFEIKVSLQYKMNTVFYLSLVIIPPLAMFFLWRNILYGGKTLGSYDFKTIITYYFLVQFFVSNTPFLAWLEIGDSIKNGKIDLWLLKPVNHYLFYFFRITGAWVIYWFFSIIGILILFFFLKDYIFLQVNIIKILMSFIFWIGGIFIGFTYGYILNILSFYYEKSHSIFTFSETIAYILSGSIIPLDILPFNFLWNILPFRYCGFIPAQILIGKFSYFQILIEFLKFCSWVIILTLLTKYLWKNGLKKHQSAGG